MNYNLELQKINIKLKAISIPEDRINLLKQGIKLADTHNAIEWGFDLRLDLIAEEVNTSQCIESFSAFSWILDIRDKNPETFDESDFLWEYKWMANASYRNVNISKEQIENILEDLKIRMQRNGYSLRGYYSIIIAWNQFLGKNQEVDKYLELREKEERDTMSHCLACELDTKVEIELKKGNIDEAVDMANDLITKKITCAHMPLATFSEFAYYLNKANDPRASEFFEKAIEELREMDDLDSSILSTVSLLINYLIYNDIEKAFVFYEKYSPWELNAEDSIQFTFAKNILNLFNDENKKTLKLDVNHPLYSNSNEYNLKDLYSHYYSKALDLAQRFDKRNETTAFADSLQKELKIISK